MAAKLRVVQTVALDCFEHRRELEYLPIEVGRRPFPTWYARSYFKTLADAVDLAKSRGVTLQSISNEQANSKRQLSFQNVAGQ